MGVDRIDSSPVTLKPFGRAVNAPLLQQKIPVELFDLPALFWVLRSIELFLNALDQVTLLYRFATLCEEPRGSAEINTCNPGQSSIGTPAGGFGRDPRSGLVAAP